MDKDIITPLKITRYTLSRMVSFFLVSLLLSLIILIGNFALNFNIFALLAGMITALKFKDALAFLLLGGVMMALFFLPYLELLPSWNVPVYLPTRSTLQYFRLALGLTLAKLSSLLLAPPSCLLFFRTCLAGSA